MRRRPSASTTDEEDDGPKSDAPSTPEPLDKTKKKPSDKAADRKPVSSKHLEPKPKRKNSRPADASKTAWKQSQGRPVADGKERLELRRSARDLNPESPTDLKTMARRTRLRNPWAISWLTLGTLGAAVVMLLMLVQSFTTRQLDPKGGSMSFMASSFVRFNDFDTEHTRFATKYSLHMYRELGVDEDPRVRQNAQ
jgi:hypothetical protein